MAVYVLVNGRTNAVCGVFSSPAEAGRHAMWFKIDSWHIVERSLDAPPVQLA